MKRNADQIFNKYCKLLYKISIIMLCSEEDAYDAVQESFLKYLNTKKDFNDESHERAWLTRVNINICKNILRFRRMHPTVDYETLALHYHKPEETGIMDTLMTLNAKDKEVLILYYIEGYSCKEIADMLKVSESAVIKLEKKLENISKLADDIVLTEQNERKLFIAYKKRIESQRRKKVLMRGYYRVAVVALAMMIMFSVNYYLQSPDLVVYAATGDKMVQLRLNERVNLEKQRTPLGYGYVLEMSVEEGSRYYTIENEQNLNADNIFRNGNKIFWMPDGMNSINFRDQDGNVIKIPETDSSTLNIEVCNYDGKMVERITLILERRDGQCSVEMLKK